MYYSKHGSSDVEHFEMAYYHDNGKAMTVRKERPYSDFSKTKLLY